MGIEKQYFKAEHYPLNKEYIHNELEELFAIYLEKHEIYTQELAYEVWKDSYLKIRYNLRFLLTLYFSFCTDKEAYALQNILKWKDNQIRLIYIELMWKRGLEIGIKEIEEILKSTDGSQEAFIIINENKPELLPRDPVFQNYFVTEAARFIFYNHEDGIEKFPSEVEIMGSFEWKEYEFDENLMYYVVRFKSADHVFKSKGWMRMLIGAYHTGSIPTSYNLVGLDDHYTDFETWDNKTFNEHVTDFQNFLREKHQKNIDEIFYDYIPIFDKKNNTIALISFISSFFLVLVSDWFIIPVILAPIWLLLKYFQAKKIKKNVRTRIRGYYLDYFWFNEGEYIDLQSIAEVKFEKKVLAKQDRFLFLPLKKWHFVFYDYGQEVIFSIPRHYIEAEYFFPIFKSRIAHFVNKPKITFEESV